MLNYQISIWRINCAKVVQWTISKKRNTKSRNFLASAQLHESGSFNASRLYVARPRLARTSEWKKMSYARLTTILPQAGELFPVSHPVYGKQLGNRSLCNLFAPLPLPFAALYDRRLSASLTFVKRCMLHEVTATSTGCLFPLSTQCPLPPSRSVSRNALDCESFYILPL